MTMTKISWLFYPDFRNSNPYQALLADALSSNADVRPGTITDALEVVAQTPTVFHMHWEETIFAGARDEQSAGTCTDTFLLELSVFHDLGGIVVWTMHNAAPHENAFPAASARLRATLAQSSDVVHVHGHFAFEIARDAGTPTERILTVPHPNIAPAYPNDIGREAARRYFRLGEHETVFAFVGAIRPYKGVEMLLRAFSEVYLKRPDTQLILGGRQANNREGRYVIAAPGVRLIPHFLDDGIIQYVLNAADYVVLPYNRILTSGAVALAFGFGKPAIVPDLPALLEVVQSGHNGLVFRAGDQDDLVRVMLAACGQGQETRLELQRAARRHAQAATFTDLGTALLRRVSELPSGQ
jgi:beta-1,4-mannosyltransferase